MQWKGLEGERPKDAHQHNPHGENATVWRFLGENADNSSDRSSIQYTSTDISDTAGAYYLHHTLFTSKVQLTDLEGDRGSRKRSYGNP